MAENETNKRTEILDIQVKYEDALNGISQYNDKITAIRANQKKLNDDLKAGTISQTDYNKAMAASKIEANEYQNSIRILTKEVQNNIRANQSEEGSINSLRATVSNMRKEYDNMSKAMRNSEVGQEYLKSLNEMTSELNGAVEASQRYQHNVGNYPQLFTDMAAGGDKFAKTISGITNSGQGVIPVLKGVGTQILAIGKAIIANPVGLVVTALVAIFVAMKNAIDTSAQATSSLNRIMAPFKLLLDKVLAVLQFLVGIVLKAAEGFMDMAMAVSRLAEKLPLVGGLLKSVNDEVEKSIQLEKDRQALARTERDLTVTNAKTALEAAKLRAQAEEKSKYTAAERLKFIQQANAKEKAISEQNVKIAKEKLRIAEEEAARTENTAEIERGLAELRADVYNKELEYFNKSRELIGKENALRDEIKNTEKANADASKKAKDEALKKTKEILDKETDARRTYEAGVAKIIQDEAARQRAELNNSYANEIEDIEKKLKDKKNLSAQAEKDLQAALINVRKEYAIASDKLEKEIDDAAFQKRAERLHTDLSNRLAVLKENSQEALNANIESLNLDRETELREAEKTGADKALINAKYDHLIAEQRKATNKAANDQLLNEQNLHWQRMMQDAQLAGQSQLAVQIAQKQQEIDQIKQLDTESDAAFLERKKILENDLTSLQKSRSAEIREHYENLANATGQMFGAFSDFLGEFADQNEAFAAFSKTLSLFQILLATGEAISKGIAAAQSVPFPGNLAAIATTVAAIVANIAKATQIVKGAKTPKATGTESVAGTQSSSNLNFSEGGLVSGPGTGTSDSIVANLSNGESVLTAQATSMFSPILSMLNQMGGGVPIVAQQAAGQQLTESVLVQAFVEGVRSLPNPVVSVSEIDRVQTKVNVLENEAKI